MKIIILCSVILTAFFGCQERKVSVHKQSIEKQIEQPTFIDQSINNIILDNPKSSVSVIGKNLLNKRKLGETLTIANKSNSESLDLYFIPGNIKYSFSNFHLRFSNKNEHNTHIVKSINNFISGKGIKLGMSFKDVKMILGDGMEILSNGNQRIIQVRIEGMEKSTFLKSLNEATYFGTYIFNDNKLTEAYWGFEEP